VGLLLVAATAIYGLTARDLAARFDVPAHALPVPADSATLERGRYLATTRGCRDCHGENLGGRVLVDDPAVGRLTVPNLTPGGRGAQLTDEDMERAIRHGVRRDGTSLLIMPSNEFAGMSDEDVAAIIAYLRSVPAVTDVQPAPAPGPVLRALHVAGQLELRPAARIDHRAPHVASVPMEPTAAYGKYLAVGCTGCHGDGFSGGKMPGAPPDWKPAANITPTGIGHYSEADFIRLMRTGIRPGGVPVDTLMPWKMLREMNDTEIVALYRYLRTVPPRAYGLR
jgi:mono/diheme cytochrome c family protein